MILYSMIVSICFQLSDFDQMVQVATNPAEGLTRAGLLSGNRLAAALGVMRFLFARLSIVHV